MAAQELRWLIYLLTDLGEPPRSPPVLYVDNKAMLALCREHRLEHRTKHIALRYFLARELQQRGQPLTWPLRPTLLISLPRHFHLLALLCLTGLVTSCSPPLCLWGVPVARYGFSSPCSSPRMWAASFSDIFAAAGRKGSIFSTSSASGSSPRSSSSSFVFAGTWLAKSVLLGLFDERIGAAGVAREADVPAGGGGLTLAETPVPLLLRRPLVELGTAATGSVGVVERCGAEDDDGWLVASGVEGGDVVEIGSTTTGPSRTPFSHVTVTVLDKHRLLPKGSKCEFFQDRLEFLGHVISEAGVEIDPKKLDTVKAWQPPTNITELQSFLGFVNYVRRFVPDMARLPAPLTDLLRKGVTFTWGEKEHAAFSTLKNVLCSPHCRPTPPIRSGYQRKRHRHWSRTTTGLRQRVTAHRIRITKVASA
ncbi:unnamed protein product [Closterium sp. NIES-53]